MDTSEATRIVLSRIQSIDQENASRIMGMLLIQDYGEKEMIRLAFGPESLVHSVVLKARKELGLAPNSSPSPSRATPHPHPISLSSFFSDPHISPNVSLTCFSPITSISSNTSAALPFYGGRGADLADKFHLQDQLSFLDDGAAAAGHRRRCSVSDISLGSDDPDFGFGWRPCLYYARGYCKNGNNCRFLHCVGGADSAAADGCSPEMMSPHRQSLSSTLPYSALTANKYMDILLQQQQSETQRALMMGEDMNKFGRTRFERSDSLANPSSRQIYLTFPADSTFREEDVSNYFSIYGPVQDVRIPYQQKRMFGFVTFVYAETVRMILAKGNPHFVCDARVLVKPYKEKGKVPDKYRKQQSMERGEFSACGGPTSLDSGDPCDIQLGGARMFFNTQDMWRRKLEEQADLQQAIELQNQRLMGLQLLNVKGHNHHRALSTGAGIPSLIHSPSFFDQTPVPPFDRPSHEVIEENGSNLPTAVHATTVADQESEPTVNASAKERELTTTNCTDENGNGKESPHQQEESDIPESLEDNLPDSPFASPKAAKDCTTTFNTAGEAEEIAVAPPTSAANNNLITPSLIPPTSSSDMASFKSCYFQGPRFSSGHGPIGM
ncbi:zinc finger CCCH domain-containing protein 46-like [Actinidia eriantha]|uniref:zinc finger CCCH domain-containing protein 46-like n=1 Tax=Actinidia eriantha TaxID=165200 RepID=UPI00258DFF33|nr:zinc finger CCCH domain-containing protein 46-like [Actinidia eriantha]XP_057495885.1 zinc finger CCCH domain-containing protein 46-like [Actinidia eriantha]